MAIRRGVPHAPKNVNFGIAAVTSALSEQARDCCDAYSVAGEFFCPYIIVIHAHSVESLVHAFDHRRRTSHVEDG